MFKRRLLQVLGFLLAACSCVFALEIAIQAFIFTCAIYFGGNLIYLKAAGVMLCVLFVFHVFPVSLARTRRRLLIYSASAVASAAIFGVLYYVAEIGDPFQSEGERFSDRPFLLAAILCVFPLLRAWVRSLSLVAPVQLA